MRILLGLLVFGLSDLVSARIVESWSYAEMFDKADLVVIARRVSSKDTDEHKTLSDVEPPAKVVGVVTEFETLLVLKGGQQLTKLTLYHYRFESDTEKSFANNPNLVEFSWEHPSCLLFLRKDGGERYVPVTGQTDAGTYSVLELRGDAH